MRRESQIGARQGAVLMTLMAMYPRPVAAPLLAYAADPGGDQSRGNRVLAALEVRKLIVRDSIGRSVDRRTVLKWRITEQGTACFIEWLPSFVDAWLHGKDE